LSPPVNEPPVNEPPVEVLKEATKTVRSPFSTGWPAWVTHPVNTSAVPAGGVSTRLGVSVGLDIAWLER